MNNNNLTQTISLEPFFQMLKECGFEDRIAKVKQDIEVSSYSNRSIKADDAKSVLEYAFDYQQIMYYGIVKICVMMHHKHDSISLKVEIADKLGWSTELDPKSIVLSSKKDLFRRIQTLLNQIIPTLQSETFQELQKTMNFPKAKDFRTSTQLGYAK